MRSFTKREIEFLKENANVFGAYVCAIKLNRNIGSIISKLRKENIPYIYKKTDKTKEEIENLKFIEDENLVINFDFVTTKTPKELAYFIGFFWADGTINNGKYIVIEITSEDGENLLPIFTKICSNFKISRRKREGRKEQMTFLCLDKDFCEFLISKGKYSSTVESHEKILNYIPEKYKNYFIRGLIDGDGCFSKLDKSKKYFNITLSFDISGRYEQDWAYLIKFFKNNYKINMAVQKVKKNENSSSRIRTHNSKEIENFVEKLYECNDNIWLERKHNKIIGYIENKHNISKEHAEKKGGYYISINNENEVFVQNGKLKEFCVENNICYQNVNRLANNKIQKYRKVKIRKTF